MAEGKSEGKAECDTEAATGESIGKSNSLFHRLPRHPMLGPARPAPRCPPWRTVLVMIGIADKPEELVEKLVISLD